MSRSHTQLRRKYFSKCEVAAQADASVINPTLQTYPWRWWVLCLSLEVVVIRVITFWVGFSTVWDDIQRSYPCHFDKEIRLFRMQLFQNTPIWTFSAQILLKDDIIGTSWTGIRESDDDEYWNGSNHHRISVQYCTMVWYLTCTSSRFEHHTSEIYWSARAEKQENNDEY